MLQAWTEVNDVSMRFCEKIVNVKNSAANKNREKKLSSIFRELRLIATEVILRYESDRISMREDIRHADHVCELSEEYAFRALCFWLVTTCGSSVYKGAMPSALERVSRCLSGLWCEGGAYPFASNLSTELFEQVFERCKNLLDGCSAEIEMIGSLYEHIHKYPLKFEADGKFSIPIHIQEKDKRRLVGQFYTPAHIVDYCFERATCAAKDKFIIAVKSFAATFKDAHEQPDLQEFLDDCTVFDPSCGTGNFLLGAIRLFKRHCNNPLAVLRFSGVNLFGCELDGRAAALTRIALMIALVDCLMEIPEGDLLAEAKRLLALLRKNIRNTDTLYDAPSEYLVTSALPSGDDNRIFALVITNPPYVSFGARNQPKLLESATAYLRHKFPQSAEYKIRIHSIFQDIALRFTKTGGVASLLVPDGFLTGGYYKKLRQLLISRSKVRSLAELPADTVPGAVVGRWCVATYERTAEERIFEERSVKEQTAKEQIAKERNAAESSDYSVDLFTHIDSVPSFYALPKSLLVSPDQYRFRLVFNKIDQNLCELIDRLEPLSSQFQGRTGIRALHGQSSIVAPQSRGKQWHRGITSGSSVSPHVVTWAGDWLNIEPSLLYKGGFDSRVIENPKILIRQTGDSLIAAYDDEGLYHLNNVHSLSGRTGASLSLHYIDGLLNSRLWLYLYRLKTREQGRALAQIDIETLESMPLPEQNAAIEQQIENLTRLYRRLNSMHSSDMQVRIERAIDKLVYDLYELDQPIVQQIERCCGTLNKDAADLATASELLALQQLAASEGVVCLS